MNTPSSCARVKLTHPSVRPALPEVLAAAVRVPPPARPPIVVAVVVVVVVIVLPSVESAEPLASHRISLAGPARKLGFLGSIGILGGRLYVTKTTLL